VRTIYHLVPKHHWNPAGSDSYRAESLTTEGFIHCSYKEQVARVANQFFGGESQLLVLAIDPTRLASPVRDEDPGCGELFPYVYGPVDRIAISEVHDLTRDAQGQWVFPSELSAEPFP